ncbi:carbohydrate binding family 9 domain-containing protein [Flavobacteriaceae bacterium]|nr:carbohydrate binding family 9 domain-containing protein [Flavobacteriaceae bacterium]
MISELRTFALAVVILLTSNYSFAQINFENFQIEIKKTNEPIVIDGVLDENTWKEASVGKDFFMITPIDTGKATQFSEARVAFNDEFLYISIIFFNNAVQGDYVVESLQRDFSFGKNDNFLVALDPFDNQSTGFAFGLNAYGAQWDGTMYNGRNVDLNWDTKWYSEVAFDQEKWVCEIAIPFKSIRYEQGNQRWGINFSRLDLKASEKSSWAPVPRQFPSVSLAYAGALIWDTPPPPQGNNVSLIPYLSNNTDQTNQEASSNALKIGGDLKYSLTSALNLDVTINPDFSQAEVDQQVTNLDRFELFFPERRQFFLENADLFSNFGYKTIRPFFSRRIGLNEPIIGGIRLSGNIDENWRIGVMDIQTQKNESLDLASENFGVFTIQRKVLDRSNISMMFVNKQGLNSSNQTSASNYNRNLGLEYNYFSTDNLWDSKILLLQSFDKVKANQGQVFASHIGYQSTRWNWRVQQEYVNGEYDAEVGFVPRKNYIKLEAIGGHLFYTDSDTPLLSHGPQLGRTYFYDTDFGKKDQTDQFKYLFNFKNRSRFSLSWSENFVELLSDFDPIRTQIASLKAGTQHQWSSFTAEYDAKPQNRFTYSLGVLTGGYYNQGKRSAFLSELGYRFQPLLEINTVANYNRIELPAPWNTNSFWLLGIKANLTLSNKLFFSNLYQYNEQLGLWNFNSRFQWRYKPASDLFLVFNSNEMKIPELATGWNLTLKLNYWLNL